MRLGFRRRRRINVIELHGVIAPGPASLSAANAASLIEDAFGTANGRPVILDIDSPGGSPVQSDLIARMIRAHADDSGVRVHAVIQEVGASGGYWLACAADEIHANAMSIVGSIGVRGGGFGFPGLMEKLGVEQRLYKAGANKARFDPFSPERPEDVVFAQQLMDGLHERFKDWVRTRRARKLKADETEVFDGGFMLGEQALAAGLIDSLNDVDSLIRLLTGQAMRQRRFAPKKPGLLSRLPGMAVNAVFEAVESRAARIGLR